MAISFELKLTPLQIEFLQALELYAEGDADIHILSSTDTFNRFGIIWRRKLEREGLIEHVKPTPENTYDPDYRCCKITDKGRKVLSLIDDDVNAFIKRQQEIQKARAKRQRRRA